ncbi:hypothetical protein QJS04_geneDACA024235 [Acorus gramineus]|uniref:Uncharacterized protein n=1 Tax=Acorus gramineus TaxID=55184 RepID=A0AAV8ZZE9_ACOGR|nr:hypothetical protein QJS04_geneDACA024235 [Acorus gramineus]
MKALRQRHIRRGTFDGQRTKPHYSATILKLTPLCSFSAYMIVSDIFRGTPIAGTVLNTTQAERTWTFLDLPNELQIKIMTYYISCEDNISYEVKQPSVPIAFCISTQLREIARKDLFQPLEGLNVIPITVDSEDPPIQRPLTGNDLAHHLNWAIVVGSRTARKELLDECSVPTQPHDQAVWKSLHLLMETVLKEGDRNLAHKLLEMGVVDTMQNSLKTTVLVRASAAGYYKIVWSLLGAVDDVDAPDGDGRTALTSASAAGHGKIVKLLLNAGANAGTTGDALLSALTKGHTEIVKLLLDARDKLDVQDQVEWFALERAVAAGHESIVRILLKKGAYNGVFNDKADLLVHASKEGYVQIVKLLLGVKAKVNARNKNGHVPLMSAVRHRHADVVKLLLDKGADVSTSDDKGSVLLHASQGGYIEIVQLLLDAGADVNASNTHGDDALMSAVKERHVDVVTLLLNGRADVDTSNREGSALLHASQKGYTDIVKVLLQAEANVNAGGGYGQVALMSAVREGHTDIVKLLLHVGALIDLVKHRGRDTLACIEKRTHRDRQVAIASSSKCRCI